MAVKSSLDLDQDPRSIIGVREFDAPRELVFSVWTDAKHLAQWWGPNGFTTTTWRCECRPGGVWRFVMHGTDGRDYQNRVTFDEIVPPERIVYRHGGGDDVEPVQFRQTVIFEDLGGRRARPGDQGVWRRRGPGADHGAPGRLCRGAGIGNFQLFVSGLSERRVVIRPWSNSEGRRTMFDALLYCQVV